VHIMLTQLLVHCFLHGQKVFQGSLVMIVELIGQHHICYQVSVDELDSKSTFSFHHLVSGDVWHLSSE